jgi:hypothetical protein
MTVIRYRCCATIAFDLPKAPKDIEQKQLCHQDASVRAWVLLFQLPHLELLFHILSIEIRSVHMISVRDRQHREAQRSSRNPGPGYTRRN